MSVATPSNTVGPPSAVVPPGANTLPLPFQPPRRFANGADWLASLGGVPMDRIIFDPWPGTATEKDLLRLVERDKLFCELVDGTLVEKPVGYWEGKIAVNLIVLLSAYLHDHDLGVVTGGDATMRMKSGRVRLPDVAFVTRARLPKTFVSVPDLGPDLAVEVLSPGNTRTEMDLKLSEYFESGTRLAWIVDPGPRTVAVYHQAGAPVQLLDEQSYLDGDDVLPGLKIAVAELFRDVPRNP